MSSLVVGGVAIKVAVSSPRWTRSDGVDRSRSLDGTLRASQTGGAVRVWDFETPPVLASTEGETYKAALSTIASQLCSGDIIALPTMCSAELTDGVPTSVAGEPYVVLSFTLHEQQPAKALLRYAPGDTITGESFSRSTVGAYFSANSSLLDVAINVKRDGHYGPYPVGSIRMTKLEASRTNHLLWASDFSNAAWTKTAMTVGTGVPGMRSGTSGCTLTATSSDADLRQFLSASSSLVRTDSIWARRRTGTGNVQLYAPDASTNLILPLTDTFQRFKVTGPATTARNYELIIRTSGDAVDVEIAQMEDGAFVTSEIESTSAALARGVDSYSLPFTQPPSEMTVYAKFVERGNCLTSAGTIFQISNAGSADPRFEVYGAGVYQVFHAHGSGSVTAALVAAPAVGDLVEIVARLFGDGSVDITQSINGAAATSSAQTSAGALATAWSGTLCWLNSAGNAEVGVTDFQSFKIVAGSRSLQEMRSL